MVVLQLINYTPGAHPEPVPITALKLRSAATSRIFATTRFCQLTGSFARALSNDLLVQYEGPSRQPGLFRVNRVWVK